MNEREAVEHYEWFIAQSAPRRVLLLDAVRAIGGKVDECDYTPESLVPLWTSMTPFFEKRKMTNEEKAVFYDEIPAAGRRLKFDLRVQTTSTLCYALDIGFYVAEVYMRHYPQVHWILWKGKDRGFNKAALSGFKLPLIPMDLVSASVGRHLRDPKDTLLLDRYRVWEKDLLP